MFTYDIFSDFRAYSAATRSSFCAVGRAAAPGLLLLLVSALLCCIPVQGQVSVLTYHNDNARSGLNPNETLLTPANVNKSQFGKLFTQPVDGIIVGQPLYVPGVAVPGAGVHNLVYVATQHDSVYAFDADNNLGANSAPLWHVSFINPAAGITSVPINLQGCGGVTMFTELGITSTPVIDPNTSTLFVVAKTDENGAFIHRLHALDVATGQEKPGSPMVITGSFTANNGTVVKFVDKGQMNRPALLLANGNVYVTFGSNRCNSSSRGWVMSYDAITLQQKGAFTTSPNAWLAGIWQSGGGPAADSNGNLYACTNEGAFDANTGGQDFGSSVLKLSQGVGILTLTDYFTPYNQAALSASDLDLSAAGIMVLPDQPGPYPHLLVATGKEGTIYMLNRDNMGQYNPAGDFQIVQELVAAVGPVFGIPVYWNNRVYLSGEGTPIRAFALSNGMLSSSPVVQSIKIPSGYPPSISANGNSNGIFWIINGNSLTAFDATSLTLLYNSSQAGTRDALPTPSHFATETIANGKVYVGTRTSLVVYGLFPSVQVTGGNQQTAVVATTLPATLQVKSIDPYSGQAIPGVTLTFSDGAKGGSFGSSTVTTDSNGLASTTYTLPTKAAAYALTASSPGFGIGFFSETAVAGIPTTLARYGGNSQTAPVTTTLPLPLSAKVTDKYGNPVAGVSVTHSDGAAGGSFNPTAPVVTNTAGVASVSYTASTKAGKLTISATASGLHTLTYSETIAAGPAIAIAVLSGNNQTGAVFTPLPLPLKVEVTDQYGNGVSGINVTYSDGGVGGSFSANPALTDTTGTTSAIYTLPPVAQTITINATVGGVSAAASFKETAQ